MPPYRDPQSWRREIEEGGGAGSHGCPALRPVPFWSFPNAGSPQLLTGGPVNMPHPSPPRPVAPDSGQGLGCGLTAVSSGESMDSFLPSAGGREPGVQGVHLHSRLPWVPKRPCVLSSSPSLAQLPLGHILCSAVKVLCGLRPHPVLVTTIPA